MEPEVIKLERRGRKRSVDMQNSLADRQEKKHVRDTRSKALVGRYVEKEFEGNGIFLGKIVYYDAGLYRVDYEDEDCEDLETGEVREFLIGSDDFDDELMTRKKNLDELIAKKDMKTMNLKVEENLAGPMNFEVSQQSDFGNDEANEANEVDAIQVHSDADSSSDSCEHALERDVSLEVVAPAVIPPQLPSSSGTIGVPEESVSHLLSIYCFLRSFSIQLFLSPFGLDDFVGSLNCHIPNTLLDAVHFALMRVLRRHLGILSSNGSELASKCLRFDDWILLDTLTWPVYLAQYLMLMGYTNGPEWKDFYIDAFEKDYCTFSVTRKLMILQILCDDILDSDELRAEIDMREESKVGIDSDSVANVAAKCGPRKVHPRYSKTFAFKNKEAMEFIEETHGTKSSGYSNSLGVQGNEMDVVAAITPDGNVDECRLCGMDGTLLCCDGCPSAFHSRCIGVTQMFISEGDWYCPECTINTTESTITSGTSLRGAEVFGIDSYGQVFLGTCNHLLVLKVSINSEPCLRYYNHNDIPNVLQALCSSVEHVLYSEICKGILQYWDMPKDIVPLAETFEMSKRPADREEDGEWSTPSLPWVGKESCKGKYVVESENLVTGKNVAHAVVSCPENSCEATGFNRSLLDAVTQTEHPGQQRSGETVTHAVSRFSNMESSLKTKVDLSVSSGLVSQQVDPSRLSQQSITGKSNLTGLGRCTSGNSNIGKVNGTCAAVNTVSQINGCTERVGGIAYTKFPDDCSYTGSHFKSPAYINNYVHGEFAASAAANLAFLLSEENRGSESHASDNRRKAVSANNSLQVKAFSSAAIGFFWPNSEKKLVEVPRERCGWCLSCQASVSSKRGCLLNAAASNAIKGATKIPSALRPVTNVEGSLYGIAMYVMFLEESLSGLTGGPFRSVMFRKQWRKQLEQATTCSAIKTFLLKLEENIRTIALSGDWAKLVDDGPIESPVTQSAICAAGLTRKCGRIRKLSALSDVSSKDCLYSSSDFSWWRGGLLSKKILEGGVLPFPVVKKAVRQGGGRMIPGVCYTEASEIPKRSRQFIWRAAVEMSKTASQLGLQVRYLDFHVRWSDLVGPEQNLQDGKGPETEASAFRNAFVCDKKILKDKVIYGVSFGNQKHIPSRVMKNIIDIDQGEDGKEKYWFSETLVPLYLIKHYEEKEDELLLPLTEKPVNVVSDLQRKQLKASRKDIFCYLSLKRDNLDKCCCVSCQLDVLLRNSIKCSACGGFCHECCTISSTGGSNDKVGLLITCKQCYHSKTLPPSEKSNESPTSSLLLQGKTFQNAITVNKVAKQKSIKQPLSSVGHLRSSSKAKPPLHGSKSAAKNRPKLCSWGLRLKNSESEDSGMDFRLNNILLRGNSDDRWSEPVCHLCRKPYNADFVYICCEMCNKWYHAAAVELEESKFFEVVGFKCCRCRRVKSPICPYLDPDSNATVTAKDLHRTTPKIENLKVEQDFGIVSGQYTRLESFSPVVPKNEEILCAQVDSPLLFSLSSDDDFREHDPKLDFEWNVATTASGTEPQKLPIITRHIKPENNGDYPSSIEPNNLLNPEDETVSPNLEWDVLANGLFEDDTVFDWEGLDCEDMEFEPQTYFSFTELLAFDDCGQLGQVDASIDVMGTNYQQEPTTTSIGPTGETLLCQMCSEPFPDLSCHICGMWIHSHCSDLVEQSSFDGGNWRCSHCREWQQLI